jgi:hypothetical protein
MRGAVAVALLAGLALAGCGEAYHLRPPLPDESATLRAASAALLVHVGYIRPQSACKIALVVNDVDGRDLEAHPSSSPQVCLVLFATRGVLDVTQPELQALVAHGVAHLQLGHATTAGRRATTGIGHVGAMSAEQRRLYTEEEETEADRYAARLLNTMPRGGDCPALGAVLERIAGEGARWSEWVGQHPSAAGRAATARGFCETAR